MKVVWIPHPRGSHIQPIFNLVKTLSEQKNIELNIITNNEYSKIFANLNIVINIVNFDEKNVDYDNTNDLSNLENITNDQLDTFLCEKMVKVYADYIFETHDTRNEIKNVLENLNPDLIIRDSIDTAALDYAKSNNIPLISYVTNNIYTFEYICESTQRFQLYYGLDEAPTLLIRLFQEKTKNILLNAFDIFKEKENMRPLYFFYNREPKEDIVIACTSKSFIPDLNNCNYLINTRGIDDFSYKQKNIDNDEINFIKKNKGNIVYIACGSYMQLPLDYYNEYIGFLLKNNYAVVVSTNYYTRDDFKFVSDKLLVKLHVNQKFILDNSILFISSGGQSSIMESIYYQVPLFIDPQVNEQILNGCLIEEKLIGLTAVNMRNIEMSKIALLTILLEYYSTFKKNIVDVSNVLKKEVADNINHTIDLIKTIIKYGEDNQHV